MILLHLRFLFIRLPSSRRCGLAETVGLCFRVDSNRATSVFVLGLVCVCVCSVFCCVALFVVGWKQHCRYIVIDAMVYPKSRISEDKFGTGKALRSLGWVWYSYIWSGCEYLWLQRYMSWRSSWLEMREFFFRLWTEEDLNLEPTTLCMSRTRWVLDDVPSSILCFGRRVLLWLPFDHGCDLDIEILLQSCPRHWTETGLNIRTV